MASRREDLNAYTFSRRRTVAAFLKPSSGGDDEQAPKAMRAFVPSLVLGAVAIAAFGAYGLFKPTAPKGWQTANAIIVGKQSTARYVMVKDTSGKTELHPVLNLASARLLLNAGATVEEVNDSILNSPSVLHGAAVGIPYAPDWLPDATDAGTAKLWAACDSPGSNGSVTQSLLVLNTADAQQLSPARTLTESQALLVVTPEKKQYLIDSSGISHLLTGTAGESVSTLAGSIFGGSYYDGSAEQVNDTWLNTFTPGKPIYPPMADLGTGFKSYASYPLGSQTYRVGSVVQGQLSSQKYVVKQDGVERISDFTAQLLEFEMNGTVQTVADADIDGHNGNSGMFFENGKGWPSKGVSEVNSTQGGSRQVDCSTYTTLSDGEVRRGAWAGTTNPFAASVGSNLVYVSPGSGLLYRDSMGETTTSGKIYLLTQSGLKYPIQVSANPTASGSGATASASAGTDQANSNLARLGYGSVSPVAVPDALSLLVSSGPTLDSTDAENPQTSS